MDTKDENRHCLPVLFRLLLEELTRHAGHSDIIRESLDGATMYELMAGVEGWPETDWIKPWKPAGVSMHANP
jgi:hypothetical protein